MGIIPLRVPLVLYTDADMLDAMYSCRPRTFLASGDFYYCPNGRMGLDFAANKPLWGKGCVYDNWPDEVQRALERALHNRIHYACYQGDHIDEMLRRGIPKIDYSIEHQNVACRDLEGALILGSYYSRNAGVTKESVSVALCDDNKMVSTSDGRHFWRQSESFYPLAGVLLIQPNLKSLSLELECRYDGENQGQKNPVPKPIQVKQEPQKEILRYVPAQPVMDVEAVVNLENVL